MAVSLISGPPPLFFRHVVERFTRVSDDRIHYEFTISDPTTWTRPWSGEVPMLATDGPMFEYGCHEGTYDIHGLILGQTLTGLNAF